MFNPLNRLNLDPRVKRAMPYIILTAVAFLVLVIGYSTIKIKNIADNPGAKVSIYDQSNGGLIFDVIIRILLVFGLMYLFFAILRWWQNKKPVTLKKRLSVVETIRLSPRQSLHVVRYNDQEFLIGSTDQSMSLISEVDSGTGIESTEEPSLEEEKPEITPEEDNEIKPPEGFNGLLLKNIGAALKPHRKNEKTSPL